MKRIRVADFSTHYSGPLAARLLMELGADVIKIEQPGHGDGNRAVPPFVHGVSLSAGYLAAGVRSAAVDRRSPLFPSVVRAAAGWADVFVVGERASVLRSRGLDFATVAGANQRIVYCMLPPYGNHGPWAGWSAHGQSVDAAAGNLWVDPAGGVPAGAGPAGGAPGRTSPRWRTLGTTAAGALAALGIMYALYQRDSVDQPLCVEVSLWGSALWWSWRDVLHEANLGSPWQGFGNAGPRYGIYPTADGRRLMIAPIERKFWELFCDLTGMPAAARSRGSWAETTTDQGHAYPGEWDEIGARLAQRTLDEWLDLLAGSGVPVAPVYERAEVLRSEHARSQGVLRRVAAGDGGSIEVPRSPLRIGVGSPPSPVAPDAPVAPGAPAVGAHTDEVLAELGIV
jgi:crotonobetainyl-CoA:carnitine CoA-transferase CaiB-like acyl-CoA transferase